MGWGEQAQIALDRELNPPKGPGGNPKVDRRSTTGSNFMRCLPDQAPSLTQLTSDRTPFFGGSAAVQCRRRRRRSMSGMQLCWAERDQHGGWAEVGGADGSGGRADGSRRSCVHVMLVAQADESEGAAEGSEGPYQDSPLMSNCYGSEGGADGGSWGPHEDSILMSHADGSGGHADGGSGGSHGGSQAHGAMDMTGSTHCQSDSCSSSFSGQTSSFPFGSRHHEQRAAGHCSGAVNSRTPTGADSGMSRVGQHSMTGSVSYGICSISCSCSQYSSSGRSCIGSCCMQRHARHDCVSSLQHNRIVTLYASSVQQQGQSRTRLCATPVRSHVRHNVASVPSGLLQSRLHSRTVLSSLSTARRTHKGLQGFARSCALQRQVATRLCL